MTRGPVDSQLEIQSSTTITASTATDGLDLGDGFAPGEPGWPMIADIDVTALDDSSGNESYAGKLQESSDNSNWSDVSPEVTFDAVGNYSLKGFVSKRFVRFLPALGGTTPSMTYKAQLIPRNF